MRVLAKMGIYSIGPLIGVVSPIITLPFLTAMIGPSGWGAVAIGQSLGGAAAVAALFGWSTLGTRAVAQAELADARHIYAVSLCARGMLVLLLSAPVFLSVRTLVPESHVALAIVFASAALMTALSAGWYFIGRGEALKFLYFETGPRLLFVILGIVALLKAESPFLYSLTVFAGEFFVMAFPLLIIAKKNTSWQQLIRDTFSSFQSQLKIAFASIITLGYTRLSVTLVAALAPTATPIFAAFDRAQLMARSGIRPLVNALIGYAYSGSENAQRKQAKKATVLIMCLSTVGSGIVAIWGADLVSFIFNLEMPRIIAIFLALTIWSVAGSTCTSTFYLIPLGLQGILAKISIIQSIGAVIILTALTLFWGLWGAIVAISIVESVMLIWQIITIRGHRRSALIGAF